MSFERGKKRVQEVFTKRHITQSEKIPIRERIEGGIEIVFFFYSFEYSIHVISV